MTRAERILRDLEARLSAIAGLTVYRSRTVGLARDKLPAAILAPRADTVEARYGDLDQRRLDVSVVLVVAGEIPDKAADEYRLSTHAVMVGDQNVGTLALKVTDQGTTWELLDADGGPGVIVTTVYAITYRAHHKTLQ